jgi:hypothetical protein
MDKEKLKEISSDDGKESFSNAGFDFTGIENLASVKVEHSL